MLNLEKSRVDYGVMLQAPKDFKLDFALGSTYSLDLHALLSIPVALFYAKDLDGTARAERMDIFAAIQKTSKHLKIYCQNGKIADSKHNVLIGLIEDCVTEILPDDYSTSFHPKVWILRFTGADESVLYRTIVLSRNLTFDRSLDISYRSEGFVGDKKQNGNNPLVDFAKYLNGKHTFENSKIFLNDLAKVDFKEATPFEQQLFHPMGISGYSNPFLKPQGFEKLLIISPFLSKETLEKFADKNMASGNRYLFSREEELAQIGKETLALFECYALSNLIVDPIDELEDDSELEETNLPASRTHNLHAKMFIGEKQKTIHWFLGSANCSNAALRNNQEFLIELIGEDEKVSVENVLIDLLGPEDNRNGFFEKYEPKTRELELKTALDFRKVTNYFLHLIKEKELNIQLNKDENEKYTIIISLVSSFNKSLADYTISLAPHGCQEEMQILDYRSSCTFRNISLHNLSKFLRVRISKDKESVTFLTKVDIKLPEKRIDNIIKSIISNRENFFRLLQFLLGDTSIESFVSNKETKNGVGKNGGHWLTNQPILEKFMKAASRNPATLKDIQAVITKVGDDPKNEIIPPDFLEFWSVFEKRIK